MGWKFFGPTADSGESAVGVCRGKSTADEIFEFVNGSFVVSFAFGSNGPFDSNLSVCSIQIFPDRSNRKGRSRKRDHKRAIHKFKNRICRGSAAVETLRNGSPEMFGKEISRWFWDLDHHENLPWKISAETLRTGLIPEKGALQPSLPHGTAHEATHLQTPG